MKKFIAAFSVVSVLVPSLAFASVSITLTGGAVTVSQGHGYSEPGYSANSTVDGDITGLVNVSVPDFSLPGTYTVGYSVMDSVLDGVSAGRTVTVRGGGEMPFCSNPFAPGWNVNLPNGGCGGTSSYVAYEQPTGNGTTCPFWNGCMVRR